MREALLYYFFILSYYISLCDGWAIDEDCTGTDLQSVTRAMSTFFKMSQYAIGRANDPDPNHLGGEILQDMLGAPSEDDPTVRATVSGRLTFKRLLSDMLHIDIFIRMATKSNRYGKCSNNSNQRFAHTLLGFVSHHHRPICGNLSRQRPRSLRRKNPGT